MVVKIYYYVINNYLLKAESAVIKKKVFYAGPLFLLFCALNFSCHQFPKTIESTYTFLTPEYNNIQLLQQGDSLHFPLSENTYNEIKSFNYFEDMGTAFISFYDRRSESINIYDFYSQIRVKKIRLKKCLRDKSFYKTSVFIKNFDSIFVANLWTLYLIDSSGVVKKSIDFYRKPEAMAVFENTLPIVIKNNSIYMGVRPYVNENSFSAIRKWRVLYEFNFEKKEKELYYSLPQLYYSNLYEDRFFDYSYCVNKKGNFVFSFPADSNIYETDLSRYHIAYYAKSKSQNGLIKPISREALEKDNGYKEYLARDSYGPIYYDHYKERYLRIFRHGIGEKAAYDSVIKVRSNYSIIVFNKKFQIIAETELNTSFYFNTICFTPRGDIYAQVNAADEYALHFVRLKYRDVQEQPTKNINK